MKELQEGDIINLENGMKVYTKVPETFVYSNKKGSFDLVNTDITIGEGFENWLEGKYIVVKTSLEGGSTGRDAYPNGHRVFCQNIENQEIECNFYQSGCFTAMITDIKPVGKAELTWQIK